MQQNEESRTQKKPPSPPPEKEKKKKAAVYLDLQAPLTDKIAYDSQKRQVDMLLKLLYTKKKIVVVAGAGISVGSGGSCFTVLPLYISHCRYSSRLSFFRRPFHYSPFLKNSGKGII